jgi:hypothetical protein
MSSLANSRTDPGLLAALRALCLFAPRYAFNVVSVKQTPTAFIATTETSSFVQKELQKGSLPRGEAAKPLAPAP